MNTNSIVNPNKLTFRKFHNKNSIFTWYYLVFNNKIVHNWYVLYSEDRELFYLGYPGQGEEEDDEGTIYEEIAFTELNNAKHELVKIYNEKNNIQTQDTA